MPDMEKRYLHGPLLDFLGRKIILVMGPRQVGKTTLAKNIHPSTAYYNYDIKRDAPVFLNQEWDSKSKLVIFDELHKMKKWKLWLKGLYDDGRFEQQSVIVTGSARLDLVKKVGDSLAGRFLSFRLHPLDLKELKKMGYGTPEENYHRLALLGNFPEPFFKNDRRYAALWRRSHSDIILRQDMVSADMVRDIDGIELLIELLTKRVGSTISYNALAEDLGRDDKTIKKWLSVLESLYIVFRVSPYTGNLARSLKKAGKYYFFDMGKVDGDDAQKLENAVALALKKEIEMQEDTNGIKGNLFYLRTRDGLEIDFVVQQKNRPIRFIEVKLSDTTPSRSFANLLKDMKSTCEKIQLVKNLERSFDTKEGVRICAAVPYLSDLNFE